MSPALQQVCPLQSLLDQEMGFHEMYGIEVDYGTVYGDKRGLLHGSMLEYSPTSLLYLNSTYPSKYDQEHPLLQSTLCES